MDHSFELGPIRPPSEASSILLRVTRNCPWNRCAFCPVYKNTTFSRRDISEVLHDIDSMFHIYSRISEYLKESGESFLTEQTLIRARGTDTTPLQFYQQMAFWMNQGMKSLFLQDANSLIIKTEDLIRILMHIRNRFPTIERITSYARSHTVHRKSQDDLVEIRRAGLNRIHIGMESGSDRVLELVMKGTTAEEHISAGVRVMSAGFDLSEYYMPGLGGRELMEENALESARVINSVNPTFLRIRSTIPVPGTGLYGMMEENRWTPSTEIEKVLEIKLFLEQLENITTRIQSDHVMNLLEDIEGVFPEDRRRMLDTINRFLELPPEDQERFIIGRRIGAFRVLSQFRRDDQIEELRLSIKKQFPSLDQAILQILRNYI